MTNSKAFLAAGVGMNSWSGRMEIIGFEAHDNSLSIEALSDGFWINNLLAVCRYVKCNKLFFAHVLGAKTIVLGKL